jgi:hypothetical protein
LVVGVHRAASLREPAGHLLVTPAVLGIAVHQQQGAFRVLRQPGPAKQPQAAPDPEIRLEPAQRPCNLLQDSNSRRSRSCAARTRFR